MWMKLLPLLPCIMRSLCKTKLAPLIGLEGWGAGGWEGACCGRFHKQREAVSWLTSLDACGWRPCDAAVEISDKWGERKRERVLVKSTLGGATSGWAAQCKHISGWITCTPDRACESPQRELHNSTTLGHWGPFKRDKLWALCITVSGWSDMVTYNSRNDGIAYHFLIDCKKINKMPT